VLLLLAACWLGCGAGEGGREGVREQAAHGHVCVCV
jgi:hypothetical protein